MEIFSSTDQGKVREQNEDYLDFDAASGIAILADGMGGLNAGEIASKQAVSKIMSGLKARLAAEISAREINASEVILEQVVQQVNEAVFELSNSHYDYYGMGTTLVVAVQVAEGWLLAHVGDSRIYHFIKPGTLAKVTRDHSLVQQLIDEGVLSEAEARCSPKRNIITRAVGIGTEIVCEIHRFEFSAGEFLLMCSDGLSDLVDDSGIEKLCVRDIEDPQALCINLVDAANVAGGTDNISVVLISI